ncbi:MAG: right-handed parallel beta-helix repeat-containing protein [Prevotella sp.]|nr:right-handed parallel beta-helix repeat-containing protein [Prevotella sp.]
MRKYLLAFLLMMMSLSVYAGEIYVSPTGDDTADGTAQAPLRSVQQALRTAREWRRLNDPRIEGGITIYLHGGEYCLNEPLFIRPEDSGTPTSPTIVKSVDGEQACISGGITSNLDIGDRFPDMALIQSPIPTRQLWVNGKKAHRASQFGEGKMERILEFDPIHHTITIPTPKDVEVLKGQPSLEMVVHQRWAIAILRVKEMKIEGNKTVVSFMEPESRLEFEHPWPQPIINGEKGSSSFTLVNSSSFVNTPGSWNQWIKTNNCDILYMLRPEELNRESSAVIPRLNRLLTIEGYSQNRVHDIRFENITFEYAAWERPLRMGHVTLQGGFPLIDAYKLQQEGLPWSSTLENQAWIERPETAVSVRWAHHVDFVGCTFQHLAATALDYVVGVSDITISGNHFEDIGGTAILLGSFAEGAMEVHRPYMVAPKSDEYCKRIIVSRNVIHDATNEDWGAVGIGAGFVRDVTIDSNEVSHVNYSGICVGWGWTPHDTGMANNRITRNHVTDFALQLYDAGGIYTLSNQPGSLIEGNTVEHIGAAPYATNDRGFNIYLDAETDGFTIRNNICPEGRYGDNHPGPNIKR